MVANLKSLVIPIAPAPVVDTSWLDSLAKSAGGALDKASQDKALSRLGDATVSGQLAPNQGFLSKLFGGQQPSPVQTAATAAPGASSQIAATNPAPVQGNVSPGKPNDIYNGFITTVQNGLDVGNGKKIAITNPYGLAAVAATGRAESSFDPSKVNAAWNDPSASGQAGTAGGIMSWRNERLANLRNYAASQGEDPSNISPQTQAKFFLQEDPSLVDKLNAAQSPQEAANLMAKAWAFKGYDQPGGEAARRQAMTQNYYATQFKNQQPQTAQANTPMEQGDGQPTQVASLDPRAGMPQPSAPVFNPATASPTSMMNELGLNTPDPGQQPYRDPMVTTAGQGLPPAATGHAGSLRGVAGNLIGAQSAQQPAPQQVAQNTPAPQGGGMTTLAPGITPIARGTVSPDLIRQLLKDPQLNQVGLALWKQNAGQAASEPWQFVKLDDGTLARANQQTGEIQSVGQFGKAKGELQNVGKGGALYDASTGKWITPPEGAGGSNPDNYFGTVIKGYDADGNPQFIQPGKDGTSNKVPLPPGFKPENRFEKTDLGTSWLITDTTNGTTRQIPKDVQGEAFAKKVGTDTGEQQAGKVAAGSSLGSTLSGLDRLGSSVDDLASDPALGKVTGVEGMFPNLPGGKAAGVQARLNTLKSQIGFNVLQAMREASKTGGALGAVSDKENELLQNNLAALDQAQNEGDLRKQLQIIRQYVDGAKQRLSGAYKQMYNEDYTPVTTSDAPPPTGAIRKFNPATGAIE